MLRSATDNGTGALTGDATGEINYAFLFAFLDRIGYTGWIGCEYKPAAATQAGLGWRQQLIK